MEWRKRSQRWEGDIKWESWKTLKRSWFTSALHSASDTSFEEQSPSPANSIQDKTPYSVIPKYPNDNKHIEESCWKEPRGRCFQELACFHIPSVLGLAKEGWMTLPASLSNVTTKARQANALLSLPTAQCKSNLRPAFNNHSAFPVGVCYLKA